MLPLYRYQRVTNADILPLADLSLLTYPVILYIAWLADVSANHTVRRLVDGSVGFPLPLTAGSENVGLRFRETDGWLSVAKAAIVPLSKKGVTRFVTAMGLDRQDEMIVDSFAELDHVCLSARRQVEESPHVKVARVILVTK